MAEFAENRKRPSYSHYMQLCSFVKNRASLLELSSGLRMRTLKRPPGGVNVGGIRQKAKASFVIPLYTSVQSFVKIRASLLRLSSGNQLRTRKLKRPPGGVNVGGIRRKSKASFVFPIHKCANFRENPSKGFRIIIRKPIVDCLPTPRPPPDADDDNMRRWLGA